jgi:hypothetical protein
MESFVNVTGRPLGPPWAEEHRRAYAAGIAALAARERHHLKIRLASLQSARSIQN